MVKAEKEDTKAVLTFLMTQNRPYSTNDLLASSALKELGKATIQKNLDQLVVVMFFHSRDYFCWTDSLLPLLFQAGKVREKIYNKQKIYCVDQALVSSADNPDVSEMDGKIFTLTKEIAEDEAAIKKAEAELKTLKSSLSVKEISNQLAQVSNLLLTTSANACISVWFHKDNYIYTQIQEENAEMESKLEQLSQNKVKVSPTEVKKAKQLKDTSATEL